MEINFRERTLPEKSGEKRHQGKHEKSLTIFKGQTLNVAKDESNLFRGQKNHPRNRNHKTRR